MSSNRLEINKVSRYEAGWDPTTIFTGFTIRAVLAGTKDPITRISEKARLSKRLRREVGDEGEDWVIRDDPMTGEAEVYLKSSGPLIMWKLQDHEAFSSLFDRVEQHTDVPPDEVRDSED